MMAPKKIQHLNNFKNILYFPKLFELLIKIIIFNYIIFLVDCSFSISLRIII